MLIPRREADAGSVRGEWIGGRRGGGTWKQMLAQQCSMLATTPSLIKAPPIPCLSVAPSLIAGPSHNLCPLSDHPERLTSGWECCLPGIFCYYSSNHGIEAGSVPVVSTVGLVWLDYRGALGALYLPSPQGFTTGIACVCVCVCSSSMRSASNILESRSRSGSSWEGVTISEAVGVTTCSENSSVNVAAALFGSEVRRCSSFFYCSCSLTGEYGLTDASTQCLAMFGDALGCYLCYI